MGARLMAIVAQGDRGRVYLAPTPGHETTASKAKPEWKPETPLHGKCRVNVSNYGLSNYGDLFTPRQLVALTSFSDLVQEARERVQRDALAAGLPDDLKPVHEGGATAYADGIAAYLGCAVSRMVNYSATLCVWSSHPKDELAKQVFLRQALPMTWDYAETNPFSSAGGTLDVNIVYLGKAIDKLPGRVGGSAVQTNATQIEILSRVVSTDPP
ncbi:MAG: hypothetical protein ABH877_03785, partial [bacterium]